MLWARPDPRSGRELRELHYICKLQTYNLLQCGKRDVSAGVAQREGNRRKRKKCS